MSELAEKLLTQMTQAAGNAGSLQPAPNAEPAPAGVHEPSAFDVWRHTFQEVSRRAEDGELNSIGEDVSEKVLRQSLAAHFAHTDLGDLGKGAVGQAGEIKQQFL